MTSAQRRGAPSGPVGRAAGGGDERAGAAALSLEPARLGPADHELRRGNTSAKVTQKDPLTGEDVTVLWVKGSGGDLGSMKLDGFATCTSTGSSR